jgi:fatty acid desaturase
MQYHLEHHMYPAVPFHNLPNLREALAFDLPIAKHGLYQTWKEILSIRKNILADPTYKFVPEIPSINSEQL